LRRLLENNLGLENNALDGKDTKEFIKNELDKVSMIEDVFKWPEAWHWHAENMP
jgi:hypothetical protein